MEPAAPCRRRPARGVARAEPVAVAPAALLLMPFPLWSSQLRGPVGVSTSPCPHVFRGGRSRGDRTRTCNLRIWRPLRFRLRHTPMKLFRKEKGRLPGSGGGLRAGRWAQALGGASRCAGLLDCSSETSRVIPNAQAATADSGCCGWMTAYRRFIGWAPDRVDVGIRRYRYQNLISTVEHAPP